MRSVLLSLALVSVFSTGLSAQSADSARAAENERVVQALVEAFNRHDVDAILSLYAPGAQFYRHPSRLMFNGVKDAREEYGEMFTEESRVQMEVGNRIVHGTYVIQQERYRAAPGESPYWVSVVIYQVADGRIQNLWFVSDIEEHISPQDDAAPGGPPIR